MSEKTDPFEQLSLEDRKTAIDVAIGAILIGMRLPATGKPLYDYIATEFASSRTIPPNLAKYALRSLGRSLMALDWELVITREGETFTTKFSSKKKQGTNDEGA